MHILSCLHLFDVGDWLDEDGFVSSTSMISVLTICKTLILCVNYCMFGSVQHAFHCPILAFLASLLNGNATMMVSVKFWVDEMVQLLLFVGLSQGHYSCSSTASTFSCSPSYHFSLPRRYKWWLSQEISISLSSSVWGKLGCQPDLWAPHWWMPEKALILD